MRRLALALAAATVVSIACREQQPLQPPGRGPSALIVDGANNSGNPDFFFLPPLASDPSSNPKLGAGAFDPNQRPLMEVYSLPANPAATCPQGVRVLGPFTSVLVTGLGQYLVSWNTDQSNLVGGQIYRICMFATVDATTGLHGTLLGFVDVEPVDKGVKNVRTDDVAEFQNGRTIPVKTRVEKRAYCKNPNTDCVAQLVVASDGGTVLAERAGVLFGPGVLPGDRVVVIEEVPLKVGERCLANRSDLLEYSPCYLFRTDPGPTSFNGFATGAVCPDLSSFPNFTRFRQLFQQEHVDGLADANGDSRPCTRST